MADAGKHIPYFCIARSIDSTAVHVVDVFRPLVIPRPSTSAVDLSKNISKYTALNFHASFQTLCAHAKTILELASVFEYNNNNNNNNNNFFFFFLTH